MKKILFVMVLFAMLSISYGASDVCSMGNLTWLAIGMVIACLITAIIYMIGKSTQNKRYVALAKAQIGNIIVSILIVAFIAGSFIGICAFLTDSISYAGAYNYLNSIERDTIRTAQALTYNSLNDQFEATTYWFIGYPIVGGAGASHTAFRRAVSSEREMLMNYVMMCSLSVNVQEVILLFLENVTLSYLLPISIILRLFLPTKEVGNFLIALSIGFILVYPAGYAIFQMVDDKMADNDLIINNFDEDEELIRPINPHSLKSYDPEINVDRCGKYLYYAIFMPNFIIVLTSTFIMALYTGLKEI